MQNFCIQNERIKEMTKLALSDEILMKIDKPARYIGNELTSVCKNKDEVSIRFAMCGVSACIPRGRICTRS